MNRLLAAALRPAAVAALIIAVSAPAAQADHLQRSSPLLPSTISAQAQADISHATASKTFSKVGDSNYELLQNIYALGCIKVNWGSHEWLKATLRRYRTRAISGSSTCRSSNSFSHISAAARSAAPSPLPLLQVPVATTGMLWRDPRCDLSVTYLACELSLVEPKYVFITLGTNDPSWGIALAQTRGNLRSLISSVRAARSVPVLTTITPIALDNRQTLVGPMNDMIVTLAQEQGVPLINTWRAISRLPAQGLEDGLHLSYYGEDPLVTTVDFSTRGLRFGANARNLLFLRALQRLDSLAK